MGDVQGLLLMLPWMVYLVALAVTWKLSKRVTIGQVMQFVKPRVTALESEVEALRVSLRKHTATHAAEKSSGRKGKGEQSEPEEEASSLERIAQGEIPEGISDGMLLELFHKRDNGSQ